MAQPIPSSASASASHTPSLDVEESDVIRVLRDDGSLDPATDPNEDPARVVSIYQHMVFVRMLDERLVTLQRQGRIGFHIGSLGEEAAILGSAAVLRKQDWIFPCYREFGAALWRGMELQAYMDNMFGNAEDPVKGRQMPDHYTCRAAKFGSVSSPIGTQITQAVGFSWAAKIKKDELVALVYFGEGATSSNEFHNGMNFAGVFKTPTVMFCRNNGWAISVPVERQTASRTFAEKGIAYGIPGIRCDGNDIFAVMKATKDALAHAATGKGPVIIEAMTYRLSGHSTSDDPKAYRKEEVVEAWKKRDPMVRLRQHLEHESLWSDARQAELEGTLETKIKDAVTASEKKPAPALETMFEGVFAELPWNLKEQRDQLLRGPRAKGH